MDTVHCLHAYTGEGKGKTAVQNSTPLRAEIPLS